ncbi:MAG: endo-1,4-beta-xylanase [Prevotella sp.]|nr:endo-1,4-beta-xylanase [Prevotella sp.]
MNKIFRNSLFMLTAGVLAVACADYNETNDFSVAFDPSYALPYSNLGAVKSYLNKADYPNLSIETAVDLKEFNEQKAAKAISHAAALTNFSSLSFGYSFMPAKYVSSKGYMNFMDLKSGLSLMESIGGQVYGSPIAANEQQSDDWFSTLTAPIEVQVLPIDDKEVDYSTMTEFTGNIVRDGSKVKTGIVENFDDKGNALRIPTRAKVWIVQDFPLDPQGYYTITFTVRSEESYKSEESIVCTFSDNVIMSGSEKKKYVIRPGAWQTVKVEAAPAEGATDAYLMIEGNLNTMLYIRNVKVSHTPDNHREQTAEEISDTIHYAINKWCDGLMQANAGRIKSFDLIDKAIDTKEKLENGKYDLKHSTEKIFWQDIFGSENYAPVVSKAASEAFVKYGGNLADLKFFISETGLEKQDRFESLKYWMDIWEAKGAKIDGINAELNLSYSEDPTTQAANEATLNTLLDNLAATGKLIRLSNFDIKYQDATGAKVITDNITATQRQKLADYYAFVIKAYMTRIPTNQQNGLCKGNMVDTSDPVGLWTLKDNDWVRNATYEAFCKALSGK